tara:strand:- start:716 stop:1690 length:975 start_codon:yes stop_codon:yes gene_type:complete
MKILFVDSGNKVLPAPFVESQRLSLMNEDVLVNSFKIKGKGVIGYLKNIKLLKKELKREQYDVIHAHYVYAAWLARLTFTSIPIVLSFMGTDVYGTVNREGKTKLKGLINTFLSILIQPLVAKIIVKSKNLSRYVYLRKKMKIIPNGVNLEKFKPINRSYCRDRLKIDNKKYIMFLGDKNNYRKNFNLLKQCINALAKKNIFLLEIPYPVDPKIVPLYLNACDVVVLTSFLEGSPNIIKEAMACNQPIVSTNVGDVEWVIGEVEGCFLSKYNHVDLTNKIIEAMSFKKTQGRKKIKKLLLDEKDISKKILKIYYESSKLTPNKN